MATWNIGLFSKWAGVVGRNDPAISLAYAGAWTDLGQQSDANISARKALAYCTLMHGLINDATLTAIQADSHYLILVRWEETMGTPSFDNRLGIVTTTQKNAFVTYFQNEFGINVAKIPVIANSAGKTRRVVLRDIVADLKAL